MTDKEVTALMDNSEKMCLCVWNQDGQVCVGVNRSCIETTLGSFPRRIDFQSQAEFHDAHYTWVGRSKSLSKEMLTNFGVKHGLKFDIVVDSWDKPSLRIK